MHFKHVSESDVSTLIMQLGSGKATGCDGIPVRVVKMLCPYLAEPLSMVINRCLDEGVEHSLSPGHYFIAFVVTDFIKGFSLLLETLIT